MQANTAKRRGGDGMTTDERIGNAEQAVSDAAEDPESAFDWRLHWYPVVFVADLARERPHAFSLHDEPLVLFVDGDGQVRCLRDQCGHRAARLSDGCVRDGRLECLYHGWQYDGAGQCRHIPQLAPDKPIPPRSKVRSLPVAEAQGMVWIWPGDADLVDPSLLPLVEDLDADGVHRVDFQMDLPYDQSYLIENIIDVAHIHIAHDGIRGGGHRHLARPLTFDVLQDDARGIVSRYRSQALTASEAADNSPLLEALVEFSAPSLVRYRSVYRNPALIAGLALYSIPLGRSRCRLLYRKFSNFSDARERRKPRWLEHWIQCTILEQDMGVVVGQHAAIERADVPLQDLWLPLRSSDRLVIAYRRWLDRFGASLPYYRGFSGAKDTGATDALATSAPAQDDVVDRYQLHTRICADCSRMHARARWLARILPYVGAALLASALLAPAGWMTALPASLALLAIALAFGADWMRRRFESSP
jgi:phenylpropionate dioxygenase-like ring-hydroxylating dioxygenase large terminal subunit